MRQETEAQTISNSRDVVVGPNFNSGQSSTLAQAENGQLDLAGSLPSAAAIRPGVALTANRLSALAVPVDRPLRNQPARRVVVVEGVAVQRDSQGVSQQFDWYRSHDGAQEFGCVSRVHLGVAKLLCCHHLPLLVDVLEHRSEDLPFHLSTGHSVTSTPPASSPPLRCSRPAVRT